MDRRLHRCLDSGEPAKAEYDYIDFGRKTTLMSDGTTLISDHPTQNQVKICVNYRFVPGAAVVAKY